MPSVKMEPEADGEQPSDQAMMDALFTDNAGAPQHDEGQDDGQNGGTASHTTCLDCTSLLVKHEVDDGTELQQQSQLDPDRCVRCTTLHGVLQNSQRLIGPLAKVPLPSIGEPGWPHLGDLCLRLASVHRGSVPIEVLAASWQQQVAGRASGGVGVRVGEGTIAGAASPATTVVETEGGGDSDHDEKHGGGDGGCNGIESVKPVAVLRATTATIKPEPAGINTAVGHLGGQPTTTAPTAAAVAAGLPAERLHPEALLLDSPVNRFALDGVLPPGNSFRAIGRIRKTANEYICKLNDEFWFQQFKVLTLQALKRRWEGHERQMVGHANVDLQIAYEQVRSHLQCLILLYKALAAWSSHEDDDMLEAILPHIQQVEPALTALGGSLASDLSIYKMVGEFYKELKCNGLVAAATALKYGLLVEALGIMSKAELPRGDAAGEDGGDGETVPNGRPAKKKRVITADDYSLRWMQVPPAQFYTNMLSCGLKFRLFHMHSPVSADDPSPIKTLVAEIEHIRSLWLKNTELGDEHSIAKFLRSLADMCRCCFRAEASKPHVDAAREAMRILRLSAKDGAFLMTDVAKAMAAYEFGRFALQCCEEHCKAGLEDHAATTAFNSALALFENELEHVMENLPTSLSTNTSGGAQTFTSTTDVLKRIEAMAVAIKLAMNRWSISGVTAHEQVLVTTFENMYLGMLAVNGLMLHIAHRLVSGPLHEAADAWAAAPTHGGEPTLGSDEHKGGAESSEATPLAPTKAGATSHPRVDDNRLRMIRDASEVAERTGAQGQKLVELALSVAGGLQVVFLSATKRFGDQWVQKFDEDFKLPDLVSLFNDNGRALELATSYIMKAATLSTRGLASFGSNASSVISIAADGALVSFCKIHYEHTTEASLHFRVIGDIVDDSTAGELGKTFEHFAKTVGAPIYDEHFSDALKKCMHQIIEYKVPASVVHPSVIKTRPIHEIFGLLFSGPLSPAVAKASQDLDFNGTDQDNKQFDLKGPWEQLQHLTDVVEAVRLERLMVPCASHVDPERDMPIAEALLVLRVACAVSDAAAATAWLNEELLVKPMPAKPKDVDSLLFSNMKGGLSMTKTKITFLDGLINSSEAVLFEASGWHLPLAFATVRQWVGLLGVFVGRCQRVLLEKWADRLTQVCASCRSALPSWKACLDGGSFNTELAFRMLAKKLNDIVKEHNNIHATMSSMSTAAAFLEVSPKLQDNEVTQQSIAEAKELMSAASEAAIVCEGVDLMKDHHNKVSGSAAAKVFLTDHPKVDKNNKPSSIPEAFWTEIEAMASLACVGNSPAKVPHSGGSSSTKPSLAKAGGSQDDRYAAKGKGSSRSSASVSTTADGSMAEPVVAIKRAGSFSKLGGGFKRAKKE